MLGKLGCIVISIILLKKCIDSEAHLPLCIIEKYFKPNERGQQGRDDQWPSSAASHRSLIVWDNTLSGLSIGVCGLSAELEVEVISLAHLMGAIVDSGVRHNTRIVISLPGSPHLSGLKTGFTQQKIELVSPAWIFACWEKKKQLSCKDFIIRSGSLFFYFLFSFGILIFFSASLMDK